MSRRFIRLEVQWGRRGHRHGEAVEELGIESETELEEESSFPIGFRGDDDH